MIGSSSGSVQRWSCLSRILSSRRTEYIVKKRMRILRQQEIGDVLVAGSL